MAAVPVTAIPVTAIPVTAIPVAAVPVAAVPVTAEVGDIPVGGIPVHRVGDQSHNGAQQIDDGRHEAAARCQVLVCAADSTLCRPLEGSHKINRTSRVGLGCV